MDQDLCLSCGMCCDGTLFWAVPIDPEDVAPVKVDAEGYLRQPCACFNGRCTIYSKRPAACRGFECGVLKDVLAGRRDMASAQAQIEDMKRLVAELDAALPGSEPSVFWRAADFFVRHPLDQHDAGFRRKHAHVLKLLGAYERALKRFHVADKEPQA